MCGIIGYIGNKSASPILLEGLRRLEYRGYDSAGVAIARDADLLVRKKKGRIDEGLARLLRTAPVDGSLGIGHTRWATQGAPSDENSHPHLDASGKIAIVHNGIIENYDTLKQRLVKSGHKFRSTTDTEVLAHLIGDCYEKRRQNAAQLTCPGSRHDHGAGAHHHHHHHHDGENNLPAPSTDCLTQAVCDALREVIGTYGLAVICTDFPNTIVTARRGSPIIIGIGKDEHFIASA